MRSVCTVELHITANNIEILIAASKCPHGEFMWPENPRYLCYIWTKFGISRQIFINPLNAELNIICHLLALFGAHHILHVSRIRVKAPNTKFQGNSCSGSRADILKTNGWTDERADGRGDANSRFSRQYECAWKGNKTLTWSSVSTNVPRLGLIVHYWGEV